MKQVILFSGEWCQPCKLFKPTFNKVALETLGVNFQTIDVDTADPRITELGIRGVPTTVVLENGQIIRKQSGNMNESQLKELIK
jgi:thioredoxin-like negative regulator of GroEL